MRLLITKAWKQTTNDVIGEGKQFRDAWASIFLLVMLFSAICFCFYEYSHRNIIISFVAGFVTGGIWIALTAGPLVLWYFLFYLFCLLGVEKKISIQPSKVPGKACAILAGFITVAAWFPAFEFFKNIPILGDQVMFLFPNVDAREMPPSVYNKAYSAAREEAMADFKARWIRS